MKIGWEDKGISQEAVTNWAKLRKSVPSRQKKLRSCSRLKRNVMFLIKVFVKELIAFLNYYVCLKPLKILHFLKRDKQVLKQ